MEYDPNPVWSSYNADNGVYSIPQFPQNIRTIKRFVWEREQWSKRLQRRKDAFVGPQRSSEPGFDESIEF